MSSTASLLDVQMISAYVTHIFDPWNFFARLGSDKEIISYTKFDKSVHKFAMELHDTEKLNSECSIKLIVPKQRVIAWSEILKHWLRADVLTHDEDGVIDVSFTDHGLTEFVQREQILTCYPDWIMNHPTSVARCSLAGIQLVDESQSSDAASVFRELVLGKTLPALVTNQSQYVAELVIWISRAEYDSTATVNNRLIEKNLAVSNGSTEGPKLSCIVDSTLESGYICSNHLENSSLNKVSGDGEKTSFNRLECQDIVNPLIKSIAPVRPPPDIKFLAPKSSTKPCVKSNGSHKSVERKHPRGHNGELATDDHDENISVAHDYEAVEFMRCHVGSVEDEGIMHENAFDSHWNERIMNGSSLNCHSSSDAGSETWRNHGLDSNADVLMTQSGLYPQFNNHRMCDTACDKRSLRGNGVKPNGGHHPKVALGRAKLWSNGSHALVAAVDAGAKTCADCTAPIPLVDKQRTSPNAVVFDEIMGIIKCKSLTDEDIVEKLHKLIELNYRASPTLSSGKCIVELCIEALFEVALISQSAYSNDGAYIGFEKRVAGMIGMLKKSANFPRFMIAIMRQYEEEIVRGRVHSRVWRQHREGRSENGAKVADLRLKEVFCLLMSQLFLASRDWSSVTLSFDSAFIAMVDSWLKGLDAMEGRDSNRRLSNQVIKNCAFCLESFLGDIAKNSIPILYDTFSIALSNVKTHLLSNRLSPAIKEHLLNLLLTVQLFKVDQQANGDHHRTHNGLSQAYEQGFISSLSKEEGRQTCSADPRGSSTAGNNRVSKNMRDGGGIEARFVKDTPSVNHLGFKDNDAHYNNKNGQGFSPFKCSRSFSEEGHDNCDDCDQHDTCREHQFAEDSIFQHKRKVFGALDGNHPGFRSGDAPMLPRFGQPRRKGEKFANVDGSSPLTVFQHALLQQQISDEMSQIKPDHHLNYDDNSNEDNFSSHECLAASVCYSKNRVHEFSVGRGAPTIDSRSRRFHMGSSSGVGRNARNVEMHPSLGLERKISEVSVSCPVTDDDVDDEGQSSKHEDLVSPLMSTTYDPPVPPFPIAEIRLENKHMHYNDSKSNGSRKKTKHSVAKK